MRGVTILDHTADIGLEASADTMEEAFSLAILGMTDIVVSVDSLRETEERRIVAEGADDGSLLVALLSEALYLLDRDGFAARSASVKFIPGGAEAVLRGEVLDMSRHRVKTEIKAVTYHMLSAERHPPRVRVIFDI